MNLSCRASAQTACASTRLTFWLARLRRRFVVAAWRIALMSTVRRDPGVWWLSPTNRFGPLGAVVLGCP